MMMEINFITKEKLSEAKAIVEEIANLDDTYVAFDIEIRCFGKKEIDQYPNDYPDDGDIIYQDGSAEIRCTTYVEGRKAGHCEYSCIDDAINDLKSHLMTKTIRKRRPKSFMMDSQNAIAESKSID